MKMALQQLFLRDLGILKREITAYPSETALWQTSVGITNSGGNLCLHIIGNLKTYLGNGLAQVDYVRDREFEFAAKNVERTILHQEIDELIEIVHRALENLDDNQWNENFPIIIWEQATGMAYTLIHLHSHLMYHLGQINYHRRILGKS